jgi:predicted esterase
MFDLRRRAVVLGAGAAVVARMRAAQAAVPAFVPGEVTEFVVELPDELRRLAGPRGVPSPAMHVRVAVSVPPDFDAAREWPLVVVNATTDPGYSSSRRLLEAYRPSTSAAGWIALAADPEPDVPRADDHLFLRFALDLAALAALERSWKGAGHAPLAFAGFSGGAKLSGYLAALFRSQGARVVGVYMAGINENTLSDGLRQFRVHDDAMLAVPVFLQGGTSDRVATLAQHQAIEAALRRDGFLNVRLQVVPGGHAIDGAPLQQALRWFAERMRAGPAAAGPAASGGTR